MEFKSIKLYDIKRKEKFEYDFQTGLNIVYGGNGSGKSTVIKSLMYTFGFPITNWSDKIISDIDKYLYVVTYEVESEKYTLIRYGNEFLLNEKKYTYKSLSSEVLKKISNDIPKIKVKNGEYINPYLEDVFQFFYVDQDNSWGKETYRDVHKNWGKTKKEDYGIFFERILGYDYNEIINLKEEKENLKKKLEKNKNIVDNTNNIIETYYKGITNIPLNKEESEKQMLSAIQYKLKEREDVEKINEKILDNLDKLYRLQSLISHKEKIYKNKKTTICKTCGQKIEIEKLNNNEISKGTLLNSIIDLKKEYNKIAKKTKKLQKEISEYEIENSKYLVKDSNEKNHLEEYKKYLIKNELMSQVSELYIKNNQLNKEVTLLNSKTTKIKRKLKTKQEGLILKMNKNINEIDEHFRVENKQINNLNPIIALSDTGVEKIKKGISKYYSIFKILDESSNLTFPYIMDTLKKDDFDKINTSKIDVLYEMYLTKLKGQKIVTYAEKLDDIPQNLKKFNLIQVKEMKKMSKEDIKYSEHLLENFAEIKQNK